MEKINDQWLRLTGLLALNTILLVFIYPDMYLLQHFPFWKVAVLSLLYTWLTWELTRYILLNIRRCFPGIQNIRKRNILAPLILLPAVAILSVIKVYLTAASGYYGTATHITIYSYLYAFGMNLIYAAVITGVYEVQYYLQQWKHAFAEAEALKKENLQSQLDQLKNQVKPHFLFNSLNSLLALVDEDRQRAKKFIEELSFIYRYLLQCNEKELICLESELDFIKAFYFLLKTRFEDGLELEMDVAPHLKERMIPPLTLQMLVENAVKHNLISKASPLKIKIFTDANHNLVIINNRQKKNLSVQSAKVGLSNISAKYRLLNKPDILIQETETDFSITLNLIKNEAA